MSSTAIENPFSWFTDDPSILLITTIGLLIMTFLAFSDTIKRITDYVNKPKLVFEAGKTSIVDSKNDTEIISFWISVINEGRDVARQCSAQILATNFTKNMFIGRLSNPSKLGMIHVKWRAGNESYDTVEIYPNREGILKIPLHVITSRKELDNTRTSKIKLEEPFTELMKLGSLEPLEGDIHTHFHILITVDVFVQSKRFYKQFEIKVPSHKPPIYYDEIIFKEIS